MTNLYSGACNALKINPIVIRLNGDRKRLIVAARQASLPYI
jgi:hypothetical protein